jgi:hypothetical protein
MIYSHNLLIFIVSSIFFILFIGCNSDADIDNLTEEEENFSDSIELADTEELYCEKIYDSIRINELNKTWYPIRYWHYVDRSVFKENKLRLHTGGYDTRLGIRATGNYFVDEENKEIVFESFGELFNNVSFDILGLTEAMFVIYNQDYCPDTCYFISYDFIEDYFLDICKMKETNTQFEQRTKCDNCLLEKRPPSCVNDIHVFNFDVSFNQSFAANNSFNTDKNFYFFTYPTTSSVKIYKFTSDGDFIWEYESDSWLESAENLIYIDGAGFVSFITESDNKIIINQLSEDFVESSDTLDFPDGGLPSRTFGTIDENFTDNLSAAFVFGNTTRCLDFNGNLIWANSSFEGGTIKVHGDYITSSSSNNILISVHDKFTGEIIEYFEERPRTWDIDGDYIYTVIDGNMKKQMIGGDYVWEKDISSIVHDYELPIAGLKAANGFILGYSGRNDIFIFDQNGQHISNSSFDNSRFTNLSPSGVENIYHLEDDKFMVVSGIFNFSGALMYEVDISEEYLPMPICF